MRIEEIENPYFLKQLNINELKELSNDIRQFILENVSTTGGHLSSNLGIVELTVAMHYVFDSPEDKFIFDVGHQSYIHKILTGRAKDFKTLKKFNGMSGFQRRNESVHDFWEAGHSSTAISGASGIATARDLNNEKYDVLAILGDGAMMSGESFEALNYLGSSNSKVIIVLNDNNMSITKNVGGLSNWLSSIRTSHPYHNAKEGYTHLLLKSNAGKKIYTATKKVKDKIRDQLLHDSLFSEFGLDYIGPIDGHNFEELIRALEKVKELDHSVVLHVQTIKGKGYKKAEEDKIGLYHGVSPFDLKKGILKKNNTDTISWSTCVSNHIEHLMYKHKDICVITPAMITGSALNQIFTNFPKRSFDVGICEEHAMTFTAGLSQGGKFPFLSIYSSFSQRCYDQLNHDIARMDLPCLIGIDRCDLVGEDGSTHHGVFDISYMLSIPNLIIMAPSNQTEAQMMINTAYMNKDHPYVMRYSKASILKDNTHSEKTLTVGSWDSYNYNDNHKVSLITYGDHYNMAIKLVNEHHLPINIINARYIKPMDENMLNKIKNTSIIVYENVMVKGSLGSEVVNYYSKLNETIKISLMGIEDHYVTHGSIKELLEVEKLSPSDLLKKIQELLNEKRES